VRKNYRAVAVAYHIHLTVFLRSAALDRHLPYRRFETGQDLPDESGVVPGIEIVKEPQCEF
jgi:hypothetical protein